MLTDIVYYLIFAAYILFVVRFEPQKDWGMLTADQSVNAAQAKFEVERVGGILLIIGILHGLTSC